MQMQRDTLEAFLGTFRFRMRKTVFQLLSNFSSSTKNRNKNFFFWKICLFEILSSQSQERKCPLSAKVHQQNVKLAGQLSEVL